MTATPVTTIPATPTATTPTPPSLESGSYTCTVCTKIRRNDYHVTSESHRNHGYNNRKRPLQGASISSKGLKPHRNVGLSRQTGLTWHYSGLHTVLLLFMFICTIGSAVAQVDTTPSQVLSVLEGGTVTIPCTLSNVPPGVPIAWSAGNQIYFIDATHWHAPEPRFGIQARGTVYDLVLSGARREDDQVYECKRQDQLSTMTTHLTVMVLPDVPSITPDRNLPTEGDSIQLTCSSSQGNPPPTLHWFKGSTPITEGIVYTPTEFKFLATTSVLTRTLSRDDHLAEYRCEAENGANQNTPRVGTYIMEVQYAPVVSFAQTSPYRVIRGSNALLECVVDANPQATITWETEEGERRGGTSMLTIQGADTDHAGGYRCRAENDLGDSSDVIALEVHYSPTVTILVNNEQISIDQPSILNEHENVDLVCLVDSNPAPLAPVQWMHNGENIHSGDRLQYRPIDREATGTYMCVAENELAPTDVATLQGPAVQSGQATMQMLVQYRPSKANISGPRSATKGESATLRCNVAERGVPSASLNWTRASDQNTVLHTGSELQFSSVQLSDDGQYVCQPTNAVGDGPPDYYSLIVNERPEWLPVSGREGLPEERVINVTDTDVSLVCRARGRPAPSVTWYKDDVIIASNDPFYDVSVNEQRIDGISLDVTSTLHFRGPGRSGRSSLRIDDTGRYSCQVDSDISQTDLISRVDVVIQYAPVLNVSAEKIAIDMNDSALLECHAHSLPSAEFEWYKDQVRLFQGDHVGIMTEQVSSDGSRVTDTSEVTQHVSRLDIRSVSSQDLGRYTCLGKNLLGSNRATIDLMVKTVPDAPVRLSVTSSTWESVEVSWTHGFNGGYRQFFVVMYTSDSHGSGRHNIQIEDATRHNITGLFPSVNYTFRMFGVNELGSGTYSQQLQGSTNAFTIEPPTDVYYDEQTSVLSFRSPSTNYCVHVELYRDGEWSTYEGCENALGGSVELNQGGVQAARVKLCLKRRQQICSPPESAVIVEPPAEDLPVETIIIVACICGTIVVVLSIILIVLCCRRYKTTQKEQEADANRDTTVFHTQTSGGGPPNGRPSSPVKPTIKGIDNPAMEVDNLTLQEQYAIEGATTNQTDTSDYIRHDSLNPPQLTHYDSTYGTYNKNGYPGNGFTNSNGHLPQDPPPNYNEVSHMERNPSRLSARIDNNKVNNNNRSLSNVSDRRPKKRPSDMIDMDPPHDPTYDSSNNLHTNLPLRQYPPHGSDSGVSMPDPSSVKPKKVIYEVIV